MANEVQRPALAPVELACLQRIWDLYQRGKDGSAWPIPSLLARHLTTPRGQELTAVLRRLEDHGYLVYDSAKHLSEPQLVLRVRGLASLDDQGGGLGRDFLDLLEWVVALDREHLADNDHPAAEATSTGFIQWLATHKRVATDVPRAAISARDLLWLIRHEPITGGGGYDHESGSWSFLVRTDISDFTGARTLEDYLRALDKRAPSAGQPSAAEPSPSRRRRLRHRVKSWGPWHPNNMAAGITQGVLATFVVLGITAMAVWLWPRDHTPRHTETAGGTVLTHSDYQTAQGASGPSISPGQVVDVTCRTQGFAVQPDGNTWWYKLPDAPWSGSYFATADGFLNGAPTSTPFKDTPKVDLKVPTC